MTKSAIRIARDEAPAHMPPRRSVSAQMQERFLRRKHWRRFVAVAYIISMTAWLAWRFTIINPESLTLSLMYYAADCMAFILGLKAVFGTWNYSHRIPLPAPLNVSVDVLIPAYKEPLWMIRRTVMAALNIKYPHNVLLLDDGKRDEMKDLAAELGVIYLRRPDNRYAKAGNLNYGLQHSKAEFVLVFDADHIALPHALDILLGFFDDEKVALVQTPQDYYNIDAFQYMEAPRTGGLWNDQSIFFNIIQPSADGWDAGECIGTGVVYRRAALDAIGGIPVETVTEDTHTALRLHKAGYRTLYVNEPVAYGIAVGDLAEFYKTRRRWGHGTMQVARIENILFCKGLSLAQRVHYLSIALLYLEGWQQLLLFMIPVITLAFGVQPFVITIFNVLVVMAFPFLSFLMVQELGCGFARYWANEIFAMARWPVHLLSFLGLFGGKLKFQTSNKSIQGRVNWQLMAPQLAVMIAGILSICVAVTRLAQTGFRKGPLTTFFETVITTRAIPHIDFHAVLSSGYSTDFVVVAGAWTMYNVARVFFFVRKAVHDTKNNHEFYRFRVPVPVAFSPQARGRITGLSEDWVQMVSYKDHPDLRAGSIIDCTAFMPGGPVPLKVAVENLEPGEGTTTIEGSLVWNSVAERDRLAAGLYYVDWHREFQHRSAYFLTPSDVALSCIGIHPPVQRPAASWRAILLETDGNKSNYGMISGLENAGRSTSLVLFTPLAIGQTYACTGFADKAPQALRVQIMVEEDLLSLVPEGLDGATPYRYTVRVTAS